VNSVAVAKVEPAGAEHVRVLALVRAEWGDDELAVEYDFSAVRRGHDPLFAVGLAKNDVISRNGKHTSICTAKGFAPRHLRQRCTPLSRLLLEVPVGWNPHGIHVLPFYHEPTSRSIELEVLGAAGCHECLAAAGRDLRLHDRAISETVPEHVLLDTDHDI